MLALATTPVAYAQTPDAAPAPDPAPAPAAAPEAAVDPAAKELLSDSAKAYAALKGLSMKYTVTDQRGDKTSTLNGSISFLRPGKAKIEITDGKEVNTTLADGKKLFSQVDATTFQGTPIPEAAALVTVLQRMPSALSVFLPGLVNGTSPLDEGNLSGVTVKLLPENGISMIPASAPGGPEIAFTVYFDPTDKLMRRVEASVSYQGKKTVNLTTLTDVQVNPQFTPASFAFKAAPGVKVVAEIPNYDARLKVGAVPFALKGKDLNGKTVSWSQYKGKVVLLDFWATWCGPCIGELPNVLKAYQTYKPKGFEIVGVSLDEDKKALTDFIKARKLNYVNVFDGKGWKNIDSTTYGVRAIPFTLLIGKDGKIAAVNPRGPLLEPALKKALAQKVTAPAAKPAAKPMAKPAVKTIALKK
jgi:outer membrane lipoprotein-sorting protein/peroxiredoxin